MSATNTQSALSSEAEAYIAQAKEAFASSSDGYELPAGANAEEINNYYHDVAAYAKTQAENACAKNGYVDTRTAAYADMQAADKDREAFDKRNDWFQSQNPYKGLGDQDKLREDYDNAVANGQTELAEALSKDIDAINSVGLDISNRKATAQTTYDNAGYGIDARDTEIAFWDVWLKGDPEATNSAFEAYKNADDKNFKFNVRPEMAANIQSQADADAYRKACEEHGIDVDGDSEVTAAAVNEGKLFKPQTAEVTSVNYSAQPASDEVQSIADTKTDPYAGFEKPACPSGMPSGAYEQMCAMKEREHKQSVNEARAAEIMASGDYKNSNDYLNQLVEEGYDVAAVQSIMDEKSKTSEQTAEVAESNAKSSEKPNPYAFEKPERSENMSDKDYDNMCRLAEAEHIDKVNREFAADVNAGKYGNGEERKAALEALGADYSAVQSVINNEYVPLYETEAAKQAEAVKQTAVSSISEAEMAAATQKISLDGITDTAPVVDTSKQPVNESAVTDKKQSNVFSPVETKAEVSEKKTVGSSNRRQIGTGVESVNKTLTKTEAKPEVQDKPAEKAPSAASQSDKKGYYATLAENAYIDQPKADPYISTPKTDAYISAPKFDPYISSPKQADATIDTGKVLSGSDAAYIKKAPSASRFNEGTHIADNVKQHGNTEMAYDND